MHSQVPFAKVTDSRLFSWETVIEADASCTGWAGCLETNNGDLIAAHVFDEFEMNQSSPYREMMALYNSLLSFKHFLSGKCISVFTDNAVVPAIARKGSMVKLIGDTAKKVYGFCCTEMIKLEVAWRPRELNQQADFSGKYRDWDDWAIADELFKIL